MRQQISASFTVLRQRPYTVCGSPAFPMNNWVIAAEKGPFHAINTRNVWRNTESKIGGSNFRPAGSRHQSDDRPLEAVCETLTSLLVDIVCLKGDTGVQNLTKLSFWWKWDMDWFWHLKIFCNLHSPVPNKPNGSCGRKAPRKKEFWHFKISCNRSVSYFTCIMSLPCIICQ